MSHFASYKINTTALQINIFKHHTILCTIYIPGKVNYVCNQIRTFLHVNSGVSGERVAIPLPPILVQISQDG